MNITIHRDGQNYGPYTMEQVKEAVKEGSLVHSDLAWHEGGREWITLGEVIRKFTPPPETAPSLPPPILPQPQLNNIGAADDTKTLKGSGKPEGVPDKINRWMDKVSAKLNRKAEDENQKPNSNGCFSPGCISLFAILLGLYLLSKCSSSSSTETAASTPVQTTTSVQPAAPPACVGQWVAALPVTVMGENSIVGSLLVVSDKGDIHLTLHTASYGDVTYDGHYKVDTTDETRVRLTGTMIHNDAQLDFDIICRNASPEALDFNGGAVRPAELNLVIGSATYTRAPSSGQTGDQAETPPAKPTMESVAGTYCEKNNENMTWTLLPDGTFTTDDYNITPGKIDGQWSLKGSKGRDVEFTLNGGRFALLFLDMDSHGQMLGTMSGQGCQLKKVQ